MNDLDQELICKLMDIAAKALNESKQLKSQIEREQKCVELAVEALEYYERFYALPDDVILKDRIGGGKAYEVLTKIKSLREGKNDT